MMPVDPEGVESLATALYERRTKFNASGVGKTSGRMVSVGFTHG
jgi:hypothetical protein